MIGVNTRGCEVTVFAVCSLVMDGCGGYTCVNKQYVMVSAKVDGTEAEFSFFN